MTRRAASLAMAFGAAALGGCASSSWLEEKKLARVAFPRGALPIMLFRSDHMRRIDREGVTDAIASALSSALWEYSIETTVVELAGAARSPRIELAVWNIQAGTPGTANPPAITVDCAYVSPGEQIAFVGRLRVVNQTAQEVDTVTSFEQVARAIAEKLTSLA
jgi:hypothetical protein